MNPVPEKCRVPAAICVAWQTETNARYWNKPGHFHCFQWNEGGSASLTYFVLQLSSCPSQASAQTAKNRQKKDPADQRNKEVAWELECRKKKIWLSPAVLLCWTGFVSQQLIIYMYWNTCLSSVDYGKKWVAFKYSLKHQSGPEGVINGMKSSWRQASNKGLIQGVSCGFSPFKHLH